MGQKLELEAADGHRLSAYAAQPPAKPKAAVVILQEIFGVNHHIRSVVDRYAGDGFLAVAPALFDRFAPDVQLGYDAQGMQQGMGIVQKLDPEKTMQDVAAALDYAGSQVGPEHAGVVGFCWGGTLAWLAATRLHPAAAVGYYGGNISKYANETPRCPVMLHFGEHDAHIPRKEIDKIRQAHPEVPTFLYDAGHGFNCDARKDYNPEAARLARERTLAFFREHLLGADKQVLAG